ncbi:structure-specific endonuclease subunit SLX1 isoform X2 [Cygnus olor]|uniref:structure-specific endonuclease subunit SLX1 isoform X2 n=1 Tax=Cygnus olor TaxID=8869 RepID=UPI001ADEA382|nr:structure-specific endonuclease subunit SLX1 isoform X2 [Cygnus olor]
MSLRAVYLLRSAAPGARGGAYVGFSLDPERRLRQHNAGRRHGGAWRTSGRGPWEMELYVHGFPSDVAALRGPDSAPLRCPRPGCLAVTHALCLAPRFLRSEPRELLPLRGACPGCQQDVLWGELIRHYHGYHDDEEEEAGLEDPELGHWTDELRLRQGAGPARGSAPCCAS